MTVVFNVMCWVQNYVRSTQGYKYVYNKLHLEEIQQKPVNKWKHVNKINSNTIPDGFFQKLLPKELQIAKVKILCQFPNLCHKLK